MKSTNANHVDGVEPKFKIGDVVFSKDSMKTYFIVDVVLGTKNIYGKWITGEKEVTVIDGYVLRTGEMLVWTHIENQYIFRLIARNKRDCPVCGGELVEKYSEYVGGNIQKCIKCGYC